VEHLSCFDSLVRPVKINWQHDLSSNKTKPVLYCTQYFTGVLTLIGSCVLKASVSWVSADMLTLSWHIGRYSVDMFTDTRPTYWPTSTDTHVSRHSANTSLTPSWHLGDTSPTLSQHYVHLVGSCCWPLSSLLKYQIIFSIPLRWSFGGPRPFLTFHTGNILPSQTVFSSYACRDLKLH